MTATTVGHRATVTDFSRTTLGHDGLMRAWRSVRKHMILSGLTLGGLMAADNLSRSLPRFVPQIENLNPLISLDALRWGAIAATVAGRTMTMDGAQTTRYSVTVDLHSALSKADGPNKTAFLATIGSRIGTAAGSPSAGDSSRLQLQVWLNERGRVVQLRTPSLLGVDAITMVLRPLVTPMAVHPPAAIRSVAITSLIPSGERESTGGGDSDGA